MPEQPPPVSWTSVESSNVGAIKHDGDETLYVRFLSGAIYAYEPVPVQYFWDMLNAPSRGRYLNQYIKPFFRCTKL